MVEIVKLDSETTVACVRLMEKLERSRKKGESKGIKKGETIGLEKGIRICQQINTGNTDNKAIAEACGCTAEEVKSIRKQFGI